MMTLNQENLTIRMEGSVTAPPSIEGLLAEISDAADAKEDLLLSPGELRVLTNYLRSDAT